VGGGSGQYGGWGLTVSFVEVKSWRTRSDAQEDTSRYRAQEFLPPLDWTFP
jgi:hypothetical protein